MMRNTFWMTAREAELERQMADAKAEAVREIGRMRATQPNYPFTENMVFCPSHDRDSHVIDVVICANCRRGENV